MMVARRRTLGFIARRFLSAAAAAEPEPEEKIKGIVVGAHLDEEDKLRFTEAGHTFNGKTGGKLEELVLMNPPLHLGQCHLFTKLESEYHYATVVGLGPPMAGINMDEGVDETRENIRIGVGAGIRRLRKMGVTDVSIEKMGDVEAAAEGGALASWRYQELKKTTVKEKPMRLHQLVEDETEAWERGLILAEAQNLARRLADTPANKMTPAYFTQAAIDALCPLKVNIEVKNMDWIKAKKMGALLGVSKGSCEPPLFLEITYCGGPSDLPPVALVGGGTTFDAGGLCLKRCPDFAELRADMAGAAVVVGVFMAAAKLKLKVNLQAALPLSENMPSGRALKPGDVLVASNGVTIQIDNTDHEARLMTADALIYASKNFKPGLVLDIVTLTEGMRIALGESATGVFTNHNSMWKMIQASSLVTGDRVWRFPLWKYFHRRVTQLTAADMSNVGAGPGGGLCRAAAFLMSFLPHGLSWVHMDISGCGKMTEQQDVPYLQGGRMSGRPTRTVVEFLERLSKQPDLLVAPPSTGCT